MCEAQEVNMASTFPSQLKMLEALQDIEIASRLVGFDADNDDSLDEKYKKLRCSMNPLPHDSEDYQLIEKYLLTTHAPTHTVGLHLDTLEHTVLVTNYNILNI